MLARTNVQAKKIKTYARKPKREKGREGERRGRKRGREGKGEEGGEEERRKPGRGRVACTGHTLRVIESGGDAEAIS